LVRNPDKKMQRFSQELSGLYAFTDALPGYTCKVHMPDRANKNSKLHINRLEMYITPTLESFLTEEVLHNDFDFGPDLLGGDGSKIADPAIFLERKERNKSRKVD